MSPTSKAFQLPSPVVLSSQCSVLSGSNATPNMSELSYPSRKALLIDEIRFDFWTAINQANIGSFIYVKLQLGQHYLMRDPVPVWLLGTMMDLDEEERSDVYLATTLAVSHYRWKLPEPLYVEAGQTLTPVFSFVPHVDTAAVTSVTAQISYAGRVLPPQVPRPSTIVVPYAAPFVTTLGNVYQQSNERNLFNPFNKPLRVQRMIGRVADGLTQLQPSFTPLASITGSGSNSLPTVMIDDSWGGKVVNNLVGVGDVFDAARDAWTFDTVMPAKGQYNVRVWNIYENYQVHIAMVGSRQEAI